MFEIVLPIVVMSGIGLVAVYVAGIVDSLLGTTID